MAPRVSIVLPIYNESADIEVALGRIAMQTYSDFEVLLADGGSSDNTAEIVESFAASDPRFRLVANPRKLQSAGLNTALSECRGEFLVRLDGHSFVDDDYVERCVSLLDETGAGVVGGRMAAQPVDSLVGKAIALANEGRWGAGPARFHAGAESGPAETVYLGAFRTAVVRTLGGWAEDVGVNEDYELNHRISEAGHVVWFDASLAVGYRPRSTYKSLAIQYFRYGRSKAIVMRRHPRSVRLRQLLPAGLVPAMVVAAVPGLRPLGLLAIGTHGAAVAGGAGMEKDASLQVRAAGALAGTIMHWSWSAGFWFGLARRFPAAATSA